MKVLKLLAMLIVICTIIGIDGSTLQADTTRQSINLQSDGGDPTPLPPDPPPPPPPE